MLAIETLVTTKQSEITAQRDELISDSGRWAAFWIEAGFTDRPLPSVDFSREMVIVAALGTQADSCKSIAVASVTSDAARIVIHVEEQRLPASCTSHL